MAGAQVAREARGHCVKAILLCAGRGSRLDPLTAKQPKCLVSVDGHTILDHQISALQAADIDEIMVVGGYRFDQLDVHISTMPVNRRPELVQNPFWETTSSIGSVWIARTALAAPFCLLNGDTIFEPALIRDALGSMKDGINLVVEHGPPETDDMRVAASKGRIITVGKLLCPLVGSARSLGIILSPDSDGGQYKSALEAVIGQPKGEQLFHHDIIDRIAQTSIVHALTVEGYAWQEIDRPEDIVAWERRSMRNAA